MEAMLITLPQYPFLPFPGQRLGLKRRRFLGLDPQPRPNPVQ